MMQKAGVDWTVEKQDLVTAGGSTVKIQTTHLFVHLTVQFLMLLVRVGIQCKTLMHLTSLRSM